jgi:hypothetical protein
MGHEEGGGRDVAGRARTDQLAHRPTRDWTRWTDPHPCATVRRGPGQAQLSFPRAPWAQGYNHPTERERERERERRAVGHGSQVMARLKKIARRIITAPSSTVVIF